MNRRNTIDPFLVFLVTVAAPILPAGPGVASARTDPMGGTGGGPIAGFLQVQVVREGTGEVLPGAFVMVGPREGEPFPGNWGWTDADGRIEFADPSLQGPAVVTAGASGHAYFTIMGIDANDLVLPLHERSGPPPTYQVGDYVSGIDVNNGPFHAGDGNVDMAFVLPSFRLEDLVTAGASSIMGPPEVIEIMGEQFEVPSNLFIPQQWEVFVEIIKDHYALALPEGQSTLVALSGRVPLDALMNMQDMTDLIGVVDWRETDVLDWNVTGDTADADLNVDPDLVDTVTLNLANLPDDCMAYAFSLGDLDDLAGLGRVIPLGLNALDCPAGSGPCAGALTLSTTAATGEFSGMGYLPMVVVGHHATDDQLVLLDRDAHAQTYVEEMSSFYRLLDLGYALGTFTVNDVENAEAGSPPVHLQIANLADAASGEVFWRFFLPGGLLSFGAPGLPGEAPSTQPLGTGARWDHAAVGLGYDLPAFDYNAFAFSDMFAHGTHFAADRLDVVYYGDPAGAPDGAPMTGLALLYPNPARDGLRIRFTLPSPGSAALTVFAADGRRVAASLVSPGLDAGVHEIFWEGFDGRGARVPSGAYVARLAGPGLHRTWRFVLSR